MPINQRCRICEFVGNHGFDLTNGGMYFYHDKADGTTCRYWIGDDGKTYRTHLDLFKSVTMPRARKSNDPGIEDWIKARIADLSGRPRIAKRHYDAWKLANDNL